MKISSKIIDNIILVILITSSVFFVNFLFIFLGINQKNSYYLVTPSGSSVLGASEIISKDETVKITKEDYDMIKRMIIDVGYIQGAETEIKDDVEEIEDNSTINYNHIQEQIKELEKSDLEILTEVNILAERQSNTEKVLNNLKDFIYPIITSIIVLLAGEVFKKLKSLNSNSK